RRTGLVVGYLGGLVGAAVSVVSAVEQSYWLLLLGSLIFGAGFAANFLSRYAASDVTISKDRGKAISMVVWGATVGAVVGPSLVGPAGDWGARFGLPPIAGAFAIAVGTFGIASAIVFSLLRPDPLSVSHLVAARDPALREAAPPSPLRELLARPGVQVALVTLMFSNMVMIGIMSMTPVYMHEHGHALPLVGIVVSAHVVGM